MTSLTVLLPLVGLTSAALGQAELPAPVGWPAPQPAPASTPGQDYAPPLSDAVADGAPVIYEAAADAGPDESCFMVGRKLGEQVVAWGRSAASANGQRYDVKRQLGADGYLAATLPERSQDGLFLLWCGNEAGWSRPIRLNAPQIWWTSPAHPTPGGELHVIGRDIGQRPSRSVAHVYLAAPGQPGRWLTCVHSVKYMASVALPADLAPGDYQVWVHAGMGGRFGWSEPLPVTIAAVALAPTKTASPDPPAEGLAPLQSTINELAAAGGGTLKLSAGTYPFEGTLQVPDHVTIEGAGMEQTRLQLVFSRPETFPWLTGGWNEGPGRVHSVGDLMAWGIDAPAGTWQVWLRYATEMSPWNQPGVSGNMSLRVDGGEPVPLEALGNTGSFGAFRWARSASLDIPDGARELIWRNDKGGGINLDAIVLARDLAYTPSDAPWPADGEGVIVIQAEAPARFETKEGTLPGGVQATAWLKGQGAAIRDLTLAGNPQTNLGVLIRSPKPHTWLADCALTRVKAVDHDGKSSENCGVLVELADNAQVRNCELWGRAPIFLRGAVDSVFKDNLLIPQTLWGGNAEAAILGRNERLERCVVDHNLVGSPPGAESGGPTVRRLIWVSTGRGSISHNLFVGNGVTGAVGPGAETGAMQARFGGVAGSDQNVGEMILFEGNHRTAYFGPLAGAGAASVILPESIPDTPDERLGSVKREQLAHDDQGRETPFWPPDELSDSPEPPLTEYYVTIMNGVGQGQTRRVVSREGTTLRLDRPWRVAPEQGSVVVVATAFYQNHILGNYTPDGMTGVQLWISCIENIVAANSIARQRKEGIFLYANGTTLASSMPRTWNRGISPLFFNLVEGNRADETKAGILVTSGDAAGLPVEFPRALGNTLRHNSLIRSRLQGVNIVSRGGDQSEPSVLGTIAEFNVVRDAPVAYYVGAGADGVMFRRDHAYFWYPVNSGGEPGVAFKIDRPKANVVIGENTVEGIAGTGDQAIVELERIDDGE